MEDLEAKASYTFCEIAGKLGFGELLPSQQCSGMEDSRTESPAFFQESEGQR